MSQLGVRQENDPLVALRVSPHSQQQVARRCPFSQGCVTRTNKACIMHTTRMKWSQTTRLVGEEDKEVEDYDQSECDKSLSTVRVMLATS